MADESFDGSPASSASADRVLQEAFKRLDIDQLWKLCEGQGRAPGEFEQDLWEAIGDYRSTADVKVFLPARERNPQYNKLQKSIDGLKTQLDELHEFLEFEIIAVSIDFEPDQPDDDEYYWPGLDEGYTYGEYQIARVLEHLGEFEKIVQAARDRHKRSKGKPKKNQSFEDTILRLGRVFEKHSGKPAMSKYRYDDLLNDADDPDGESQPYQGPFFDYLHMIFWTINGRQEPTSHAIGDAARRAFELRK